MTDHAILSNESRAICGICSAGCWVIVGYDDDGKIASVRADDTSYFGAICKVGECSPDIVYSKDRLLHPMKRKGPKGTYEFEQVTWDEAYETIVARLRETKDRWGPEAAAVYTGSGGFELAFCDLMTPAGVRVSSASSVLFPFGSPNTLGVGALCYVAFAMIAPHVTIGSMYIDMFSDIENADLVVVWGKNPAAHCPPHDFRSIEAAYRRGARIVVIDPRKTAVAKYPNAEWIPIRPGTDGALALGLCNVLVEEELYDEAFAKDWTLGFDRFADYIWHFRPEVEEQITGVAANTVRWLARTMVAAKGAAPVMYSGLEYSDGSVQAIRAIIVLWALAGKLDVPGGWCFRMPQNRFPINRRRLVANPDVRKAAGYNSFPLYTKYRGELHASVLPEAVLKGRPYPIRSLISLGASIICSWPQSSIWRDTLAGLDFLVCVDRQLTADAAYADILLPAVTYFEMQSYMVYGSIFRIRERVIEPVGEARSDLLILAELARRLGYGHLYPQTEEEILQRALEGSGYTPAEVRAAGGMVQIPAAMMQYRKWQKGLLRTDGQPGFETHSGKVEIASTILEEYGYEPLPVYVEPGEGPISQPDLTARFPLVFNSGARSNVDLHALHQSIPALLEERPVPTVTINTRDAKERGIDNGDAVDIKTERGEVRMHAMVTDDIVRGAVEASAMGGGALGPDAWRRACVNDLTDLKRFDPISGFPVYKALLCDVVKAPDGSAVIMEPGGEYTTDNTVERHERHGSIYLDHNATTPIDPAVKVALVEAMECYGNPSSIHSCGRDARAAVANARRSVSALLNCTARRLIFTGGGSEANNLAIKGVAFASGGRKHIITTAIEHPSVLSTCRWLEKAGFPVTYLGVDRCGMVDPADLAAALRDTTCLVSVMLANNETGCVQPIAELARIARAQNVVFHTDAVQAAGRIPINIEDLNVDLLTLSAHKLHGPKGVGALYMRGGMHFDALVSGGHQEWGLRAGTENVPGIVGFGKAAELAMDRIPDMARVRRMRDRLEAGLLRTLAGAKTVGHSAWRLPNTLNVTLPGIRGESLVIALDQMGIAISSGSACRSGDPEPSHALLAMGLTEGEAHCSVRFSLGLSNTAEEIDRTLASVTHIVNENKEIVRFVSCR